MSGSGTGTAAGADRVRARLGEYYARYYRDTLGIPGWRDLVGIRLDDDAHEGQRLARLERALDRGLGGLRLLNVGCGTGGFNVAAARAGAKTWGVDVDVEALGIARTRAGPAGLLAASAEALPFPSGSFDVVYCYSTLEHLDDAARALGEMVRVLGPEGTLYLHTPSRWACFETHYKVLWVPGLPRWLGRLYLACRGRPTGFLSTLRLLTLAECTRGLTTAGIRRIRTLEGDPPREAGGRLWPLVRLYYKLSRVRPHIELVARR